MMVPQHRRLPRGSDCPGKPLSDPLDRPWRRARVPWARHPARLRCPVHSQHAGSSGTSLEAPCLPWHLWFGRLPSLWAVESSGGYFSLRFTDQEWRRGNSHRELPNRTACRRGHLFHLPRSHWAPGAWEWGSGAGVLLFFCFNQSCRDVLKSILLPSGLGPNEAVLGHLFPVEVTGISKSSVGYRHSRWLAFSSSTPTWASVSSEPLPSCLCLCRSWGGPQLSCEYSSAPSGVHTPGTPHGSSCSAP